MICSVDGCGKAAKVRGWCGTHYEYWRQNGHPGPAGDRRARPPKGVCAVEGCSTPAATREWCSKHYSRWRAHGDPTFMKRPTYGQKRRNHATGYIDVWAPDHPLARTDGYVYEHRKVAWDHGILTDPSLTVHHINHDRHDNRPENLMALSRSEHQRRFHTDVIRNQYGTWLAHRLRNTEANSC